MTALKGQEENIHAMHFFSWSVEHWEEFQGQIQDFKLRGGGALKKIAPSENCWGISCEKSRFYDKNHIFPNCGGRREKF